ncbi:hypothetical protein BDF14DRAFT_899044 [Spinellus fusiger]|nr:hypothetical protein BDF14DRAFT_899044 [Spinellus fusiger]
MDTSSCTPSNCPLQCSPACSSTLVCTLETMTQCGVCPTPTCISRTLLGIPSAPSPSPRATENKAVLIGGMVGGFVGGALVFMAIGYLVVRYKEKRNKWPLSYTGPHQPSLSEKNIASYLLYCLCPPVYRESSHRSRSRPGLVCPSTVFSSSHSISSSSSTSSHLSLSVQRATITQAAKGVYTKPQVMRVNTLRSISPNATVRRHGSVRTILTKETSLSSESYRSSLLHPHSTASPIERVLTPTPSEPLQERVLLQEMDELLQERALMQKSEDPFHDSHSILSSPVHGSTTPKRKSSAFSTLSKSKRLERCDSMHSMESTFAGEFPWPPIALPLPPP